MPKISDFGVFPAKTPFFAIFPENGHFLPFLSKKQLAS